MKSHKLILFALAAAALVVQQVCGAAQEASRGQFQEEPAPEPYSFSYSSESLGALSNRQESGDGSGRVSGFYTIMGEDGRERRVDYVADENGYRASIKTNEIGTRAGSSGDAQYEVQAPSVQQLEAAKVTYEQYKYFEDEHASATQQAQQQQQFARQPSLFGSQQFSTSASSLNEQQERATGWRQRSSLADGQLLPLNLNQRELNLNGQFGGSIKAAQIGSQQQRGAWQGYGQNSVLQRQPLAPQSVAVDQAGYYSADRTTGGIVSQLPQVSFQPQQQVVNAQQQQQQQQRRRLFDDRLTGLDFGQQFVGQQQSNIVNEVSDQQNYGAINEEQQQQPKQQQVVEQQTTFNNSVSRQPNGFTVINTSSENEEGQRGYEQSVRPTTPNTESPLALVTQQQQVITQSPYLVGSIQTNDGEQVSTWRPSSVNSGFTFQQQQSTTTTTTTTTPVPTTQQPELTTAITETIYYQPTTTRKPSVGILTTTNGGSINLSESAGRQQQQFRGVKNGSAQRVEQTTGQQVGSWGQPQVTNRQPGVTLTQSWQPQAPSVVRLESGSPRVEYLNNQTSGVAKVVKQQAFVPLKGTKGGSLARRSMQQFWQQTQSQPAGQSVALQSAASGYSSYGNRRVAGSN